MVGERDESSKQGPESKAIIDQFFRRADGKGNER